MTTEKQMAVEATAAAIGSKVTYAGGGSAVIGWLLSSEFTALAGISLGLAGLLVNWYYRSKADRRAEREMNVCICAACSTRAPVEGVSSWEVS